MTGIKMLTIMGVAACLYALVGVAGVQGQTTTAKNGATDPAAELIGKLTRELKVTPEQARGGAGAIFGLAKSRLNPGDFAKVAAAVPGMDGLLKAAPTAKGGSDLGALGSMVPKGVGGLASLAGSFQSLGLSPAMASKFLPVLQNYIESKGGSGIGALFAGALK